jgi:PIN domain nuclease of toxin-antitoxin system
VSDVSVIDASAALALLLNEKGADVVAAALLDGAAYLSTVNYCEVMSKLCERGMPEAEAALALDELKTHVVDLDRGSAVAAAALRVRTKPIGASLGDRACLALAGEKVRAGGGRVVVYTTEKVWTKLQWPFTITVVR